MKTVLENLQKARDLLARPGGFCKGVLFDASGACCSMGAIMKAGTTWMESGWRDYDCAPEVLALDAAMPKDVKEKMAVKDGVVDPCHHNHGPHGTPISRMVAYNNTTDQQTVVALFDRAIAIQKEHPTEKVG